MSAIKPTTINDLRRFTAAHTEAGNGDLRAAVMKLSETAGAVNNSDEARRVLSPLHPTEGGLSPAEMTSLRGYAASQPGLELDEGAVTIALRGSRSRAAPGPSGWNFKHWKDIALEDHETLTALTGFLNVTMMKGCLPVPLQMMWGACNTIALAKAAQSGYRPISMGDVLRRLAGKAGMRALLARNKGLEKHFEPLQWAVNSKAGTEKVVHTMRGALEMYPGNLLIAVDSRNAFNSMNRGAFIHALSTSPFRALLPLVSQFYSVQGELILRGKNGLSVMNSVSGQQQGDTLGTLLFCIGLQPVLRDIHEKFCHRGLIIRAYADDVFLNGPPDVAVEAYKMLKDRMAALGLQVATSDTGTKTRAWSPAWEADGAATAAAQSALPTEIFRCSSGTKVLGAFIGTDAFVTSSVLAVVESTEEGGQGVR